jgi:tRNA 2-thiouridine synthesizing protein E
MLAKEIAMSLLDAIVQGDGAAEPVPGFPHAPPGWTRELALDAARRETLELSAEHWETIRALQEYHARHVATTVNARELHDALEERFHRQGGLKYLYQLFPGGPVAQGCRLAGLKAPAHAGDKGFGSVI